MRLLRFTVNAILVLLFPIWCVPFVLIGFFCLIVFHDDDSTDEKMRGERWLWER